MRSSRPMDAYTTTTLVLVGLAGGFGWLMLAAARSRRGQADALARHASTVPDALVLPLHDHLLDAALVHYSDRELRAGRTLLEFAVTLRDRLDRQAGREHGALNRAKIRSRLMPAAHRLRGDPNPFRVREFRETFLFALDGERDSRVLQPLVEAFRAAASGSG